MILVHGEETGMLRLKTELEKQFLLVPTDERPLVFNPKNCAEVSGVFCGRTRRQANSGALVKRLIGDNSPAR